MQLGTTNVVSNPLLAVLAKGSSKSEAYHKAAKYSWTLLTASSSSYHSATIVAESMGTEAVLDISAIIECAVVIRSRSVDGAG